MPATIAPLFNLYLLSPGRRIYALDRVRPLAEAREAKAIVVAISQATAHDREVRKLDARRRRGPNPVPPSAVRHDGEVDRTLDALDALLAYRVDRDGADSFAQVMRAELFPRGVKLHKRLPSPNSWSPTRRCSSCSSPSSMPPGSTPKACAR